MLENFLWNGERPNNQTAEPPKKAAFKEKIQYKTKPFKELLLTHYSFAKRVENDRLGSLRM